MKTTSRISTQLHEASSVIDEADSSVSMSTISKPLSDLSKELGIEVLQKPEYLTRVKSFKIRGSLVAMKKIPRGSICYTASAGNHAQGLAYAARLFGIRVIIFIPEKTDVTKVDAIRRLGGDWLTLQVYGNDYDEAYRQAIKECKANGGVFVSAFDNEDIIAGQGTSGLEFLRQHPDLDIVFAPVGGGGLLSGLLSAKLLLNHPCEVFGVEPAAAPSASFALASGFPVTIRTTPTLAEGAKIARIGDLPFEVLKENNAEIIQVTESEIFDALDLLHRKEQILLEGAGALPLAGLMKKLPTIEPDKKVGVVLTGANISIRKIAEAYTTMALVA